MIVDLDLLADFADGLLEADEQARVESLVRADREWATALEALRTALPSVATALASADAGPMPPAVLTATLQAIAAERAPAVQPTGESTRDVTRPRSGRPPRGRARRRTRAPALAAFALIAVVLVGLGFLVNSVVSGERAQESSGAAKVTSAVPPQGGALGDNAFKIVASGTNYTPATLPGALTTNAPALTGPDYGTTGTVTPAVPGATRAPLARSLERLQPGAALTECVAEVDGALGGTAAVVDYASYEGTPALIITLPDIDTVIAVGANCGRTGFAIDELGRS